MLEHIERLKAWQALDLPAGIERLVHQNRLLKIAREGGQMTPADLTKFEPQRRYATPVSYTHLDVYKRQGSGLGMSIVKTIAERIGAEIQLSFSDEAKGSGLRACILIPLADAGQGSTLKA